MKSRLRKRLAGGAAVVAVLALGAMASTAQANSDWAPCDTGPGQTCIVEWLMSKGQATAIAYGTSPDGPIESNPTVVKCTQASCFEGAEVSMTPGATATSWVVTGPNISIICSGPSWAC